MLLTPHVRGLSLEAKGRYMLKVRPDDDDEH